jgi:hypothetical protein
MFIEKVIHGYQVTLDTDTEGAGDDYPERVSSCWINKGDQSGSLEFLLAYGGLEDSDGQAFPVSEHTIDTIDSWAIANGY